MDDFFFEDLFGFWILGFPTFLTTEESSPDDSYGC
jgi:hypothetical protein